jgi:hypothetical protein
LLLHDEGDSAGMVRGADDRRYEAYRQLREQLRQLRHRRDPRHLREAFVERPAHSSSAESR